MTVYKQTMSEALASMYEAKMSSSQIDRLKKAYEPMRDKKISMSNANKLSAMMDKVSKDKEALIQLFKADIPFVSQSAVTKLISKHGMKGAEINKLREEVDLDEKAPKMKTNDIMRDRGKKAGPQTYQVDIKGVGRATVKANNEKMAIQKAMTQLKVNKNIKPLPKATVKVEEEVELDEAKYDLYHKDFSGAMQHAYKMAKKLHGITVDPKEIDDKVATGPRKPSEGKTNKYRLKGDKGGIQIQVYNKGGSKPFELNMYKEEVFPGIEEVFPGIEEALELFFEGFSPKEIKMAIGVASDPRYKGGNYSGAVKAIEKIKSGLSKHKQVAAVLKRQNEALDKDDELVVNKVVKKLKGASQAHAGQAKDLEKAVKEEVDLDKLPDMRDALSQVRGEEVDLDEGKMSQLHQYIKDKKSAEEIAKLMKVDAATIKKLMSEVEPEDDDEEIKEGAAADARRAMMRDKDLRRGKDSADKDDDATDDDVKAASKNIMMQLRKSISLKGRFDVEFGDKKKTKIPVAMAQAVTQKYNSLKKPADKEKFQAKIAKSYKDMLKTMKEGFEPSETILERMNRKLRENKNG